MTDPAKWKKLPGNWDVLHTEHLFPSSNAFGFPDLPHVPIAAAPHWMVAYRTRVRSEQGFDDGCVHFFLNDHHFETTWSAPRKALRYLRQFRTLLTPDFSLYADWPPVMQQWNVYRSRWCGAYWHSLGITVIPTLTWGDTHSFAFAFAGVPQRSLVAVSTVGTRRNLARKTSFLSGFRELVERLSPSLVLCYGKPHPEMTALTTLREYPDTWQGVNGARRIAKTYK